MKIDFTKDKNGLVPAIIQDARTRNILMLGYMNAEAYAKTVSEKRVTFFSRSKDRLWVKGETSGNFLYVRDILVDCDADTILIKADPVGPVCHTGNETCFNEENRAADFLFELEAIIKDRQENPSEASYTSSLLAKGTDKIAQKVGEEAVEVVIEAKNENVDAFKNEMSDLLYHLLVLLAHKNVDLSQVLAILEKRHQ